MENLMIDILDEALGIQENEEETWKIKNDEEADWWIELHQEKLAEVRRLRIQLENKIAFYHEKLDKVIKEEEVIIERRDSKLLEYFETLDKKDMKKTKTMLKYRLPSGELVKKFRAPEFKRDNDKLTLWLENNGMKEYIEVKKQAKWGELKKATEVINGTVVLKDTGEIVEGVEIVERPAEFKVEVK
ncbi:host-nuclease inhibitor Gam family protein [Tepidimicrobium xylanilyticum]|uniref:Bacteriophage Mu Gam like protein n=1 Tax=Tepidimicrobium xylanilyticum TaxID=1123352 RepID=A0A1H2YKU3_9FIRM|nr:host-nuclease inhibitor Gam family protein [Tepidimicrobium xylanilyticum]SDX05234.1 Bacteriophage Mu Gam like protein [Tepidimicrobium xylanilyticum]